MTTSRRPLPYDLDAECVVLGASLMSREAFTQAAALLDPSAFFSDAHRLIFATMVKMASHGDVIDCVNLSQSLKEAGLDHVTGGPAYLAGLLDGLPPSIHVESHAQRVKEKATLRALMRAGERLIAKAYAARPRK